MILKLFLHINSKIGYQFCYSHVKSCVLQLQETSLWFSFLFDKRSIPCQLLTYIALQMPLLLWIKEILGLLPQMVSD